MRRQLNKSQEFDAPATHQDKVVTLATLTPRIDFILPETINHVMEQQPFFFLGCFEVLPKSVLVLSR
jgi:hypothetical protein